MMELDALVSFNCVADHGGVSPAHRAIGRSKATLSRHIRELEDSLAIRLVERGARTLRLTEEGAALWARTGPLLMEISEAARDIAAGAGQPRGRLRVSVPVLFAHMAVERITAGFAARYPDVHLELSAEDRNVDLVAEGYDAVVRVNPRPDTNLVGRCFLRDRHVIVASPTRPFPRRTDDVRRTRAVILRGTTETPVWRVHREGDIVEIRPEPVMQVSSLLMLRDAVRAGAGAGVLPRSLVANDLATGRLGIWGAASERSVELWVLHTSRRLVSAKVGTFLDFLCSEFKSTTE